MESLEEENIKPKRAPRKRAPIKRESDAGEVKPRAPRKTATATITPRKRAVRKVSSAKVDFDENTIETTSEKIINDTARKAPTSFATEQQVAKRFKKQMMIVAVVLLTGIGASAAVGFTDKGQIDVQKTIEDRNERIRNNTATEKDTMISKVEVPVQDTSAIAKENKADGGLVGRGTGGTPKPKAELAAVSASTTEGTASSTGIVASSTEENSTEEDVEATETAPE